MLCKPINLYLVRHFETHANRSRKILGRSDEGIIKNNEIDSEFGCLKSLNLKDLKLYTSPSRRCRETLMKIGGNAEKIDDRLLELDFGSFDGQNLSKLTSVKKRYYRNPAINIPGGESINQLSARAQNFLDGIQMDSIVVTHGGVINAILMNCLGAKLDQFPLFKIDNGSVSKVIINEDDFFIEYVNRLK